MKLTTSLRSAIAQEILAAIAAGSAADPKIEFYTGSLPSSMGQAITDTLLAELDMSTVPGTETNGVITFGAVAQDESANATGTVGWARMLDRDGAEVMYLSVTLAGGGGGIEMNTLSLTAGGPVAITGGTFTVGGG